jgi:hypothetical protein
VALCFLLGAGFVVIGEDSFIYFPAKGGVGPSPGEDVTLACSDGVKVHGWYLAHPQAKASVLLFHGNAGNLEDRRGMIRQLRESPANVLAIDYRGSGKSEGKPSEDGLYRDARAAYEWLRAKTPAARIVAFGKSLGGGPACELALQRPAGGLVLLSTFTSVPDMAARTFPFLPVRLVVRTRFDNLDKVRRLGLPKLIVHSRRDEVIPFEMGERLARAARPPVQHLWLDRAGHNDTYFVEGERLGAALRAFADSLPAPR